MRQLGSLLRDYTKYCEYQGLTPGQDLQKGCCCGTEVCTRQSLHDDPGGHPRDDFVKLLSSNVPTHIARVINSQFEPSASPLPAAPFTEEKIANISQAVLNDPALQASLLGNEQSSATRSRKQKPRRLSPTQAAKRSHSNTEANSVNQG